METKENDPEYIRQVLLDAVEKCRKKEEMKMETNLTELLDFSDWTQSRVANIEPLTNLQLIEQESLLTNAIDEMSQTDHVKMVLTYKLKIKQLYEALDECFENAIAPIGAGLTIKPDKDSEAFATKIFRILEANK